MGHPTTGGTGRRFRIRDSARILNEILTLSAVRTEPKHGYRIACDVDRDSMGRFVLTPGTLYPTLKRLERRGLLVAEWRVKGRKKKVYSITPAGRSYLHRKLQGLQEVMSCLGACVGEGAGTPDDALQRHVRRRGTG